MAPRTLLAGIVMLVLGVSVAGQTSSATDGSTPLGLQPGSPAGSYPLSSFDNINLYNGNLNFQLSLFGISGRGGAQMPVMLPIQGKWRVIDIALPQADGSFKHHYMPMQGWWENTERKYSPGTLVARQGSVEVMTCPDNTPILALTLTRLTFTAPDGTEYELRDQLTGGQPANNTGCNYLNPPSRGKVFVTSDGSAATFVSDTTIYDHVINPNPTPETYLSGYLLMRDGTRFRIQNGNMIWMRDRNGNKLAFGYDGNNRIQTITDSLNRVVTISRNTGPGTFDQLTYKGFGGAQRTVKVNYSSLAGALRADYFSTLTYRSLFPDLDGSTTSHHNPSVISSITLPNNQQYQIRYNPYGEIARVVLPTGGAIEYDHAGGEGASAGGAHAGGYDGSWVVYRRVVERRVYPDGGAGASYASRMTYTRFQSECAGCVKVDQLNNSGTLLTRSKHYFHGNVDGSFDISPIDYANWKEGKEYQTEVFASDGTTILRKTVSTWQQPLAGASWPLTQAETGEAKTNDPQVTEIVSTIEPSQVNAVSKQTFSYDKYTNQTDVYEYNSGNGAVGPLVRRTQRVYLTSSYDSLLPNSSSPDLNLTTHIRNLPARVSIYEGAVERARSTVEYDNYVLDGADCLHSYHCPLQGRPNISGVDSFFGTSFIKRGNPTALTRHLLSGGVVTSSISTYSQYDVAGNVIRVLDPRSTLSNNIATTIEYDDRFGIPDNEARSNIAPTELTGSISYAFPTKVVNPLGHTIYAQFDYYLGRPVNGEDANGIVASGSFNDLLDRATQVRRAIGSGAENQTSFAYDDTLRVVTTSSDRDIPNDNLLVTKMLYDLMGRMKERRQYEGGSNYLATQTQYDALGRVFKTSNPFRPLNENAVWTTQVYDSLGRVISLTTPDNAIVATSYSGYSVTAIDQTGRARRSMSDALGRLVDVYEDPNGLNYQTSYYYDVLDNLVKVTQGSQQRFFMYDSLKRLMRARQPEQNTRPSLSLSDPISGNSNWSIAYQYDVNGNLTQKTDARGVVSTYVYDALNRNTTIDHSDTTAISPDVKRFYDGAANGKTRLWYTYSGGDFSTGSDVDHTSIDSYDALGRPLVQRQLFKLNGTWSPTYQLSRSYNRAGAVTSQTHASGRSVGYTYDAAGRTSTFSGNLGDGVQRTYATGIAYSQWGSLSREQFGTSAAAVYHKVHYNVRGQLFDVRASNVNDEWGGELGALVNYYSTNWAHGGSGPDNNGNVLMSQTIVNSVYVEDRYSYDELNRLTAVREYENGATPAGNQLYNYDRWGNRTINTSSTLGLNKEFAVNAATNRIGVPVGYAGVMTYDDAGNLTTDTYSGYGDRIYNADNKMIRAQDSYGGWSYYTYNADGQRVRRKINNQETWQVYGFEGELVAEYAANGPAATPKTEYGYRNGQLLITAGAAASIKWLVADHLGTPRMVIDQTGTLANIKRHDYLPFGEELPAGVAGRTTGNGYSGVDNVRQQFTSKERDVETGLDYFGARYYGNTQGRFTSPDPLMASAKTGDPQTWNRYTYVLNNPLRYVDLDGLEAQDAWSQLTKEEQEIIATKLERQQVPAGGSQTRIERPQEVFNRLFTGANAEETTALVVGVKNFIDAAGGHSNSEVWQQIGVIDGARVTANDSAAITFRVDDSKKFLAALGRNGFEVDAFYENAKWFTAEGTHRHSARQITETSKQPGLHFVQDHHHERNRFDSHFDARSSAFRQTDSAWTRQGEQIDAGKSHYRPYSSVELRQKLREQGIVPRNEP